MRRLRLVLALLLGGTLGASAQDVPDDPDRGVYRWRMTDKDGDVRLFAAKHSATDFFGQINFRCRRGSGEVRVSVDVPRDQRATFARILIDDIYPNVFLAGDGPQASAAIDTIAHSDMYGWVLHFIHPEAIPAMAILEQTGSYQIDIQGYFSASEELPRGLDAIAEFRAACRKAV